MTDVKAALRAMGRAFTPEQIAATQALYKDRVLRPTPSLCAVHRDERYGPHERNRLDVFVPVAPAKGPRPVVGFVHGGGFVGGDKGAPDAPYHNHFGAWAAREGFVGVTITYRLAPASPWPAGAEDVTAAASWLKANAARFGGDPDRILLVGQSAGGTHVATALSHPDTRRTAEGALAGAVLCSGVYDVGRADRSEFNKAYWGEDPSRFPAMSSLEGLTATSVPLMLTVSELEPPQFQRQAAWAVERIVAVRDRWPRFRYMTGHNHISPVLQLGTEGDDLGPELAALAREGWE